MDEPNTSRFVIISFRGKIASCKINLAYISTNEKLVDIITKPLVKTAFKRLKEQLGLIRLDSSKNQYKS